MKGEQIEGGLPKLYLPGEEKFQSYKTALQVYCHKMKLAIPQYLAVAENDGLVGTVSFGTNYIKCTSVALSMREADAHAACEALRQLGYLSNDHEYVTQRKRKHPDVTKSNAMETDAKLIKPGTPCAITPKAHLHQVTSKLKLGNPVYKTVAVNNGFFSTVGVGAQEFKGMSIHSKKGDAEQDAAKVALDAANTMQQANALGTPIALTSPAAPDAKPLGVQEIPAESTALTTKTKQQIGMKNLLQQYCQKVQPVVLPTYETQHNEAEKTYSAIVTVKEMQYFGVAQSSKKQAETSAAEVALISLGVVQS